MNRIVAALVLALGLLVSGVNAQFVQGHLFVTDFSANAVYDVDPTNWTYTTFLNARDGINGPSALGFTSAGNLLVSNFLTDEIMEVDAAGNVTVVLDASDGIDGPWGENGIAIDAQKNVYIANFKANEILRFDENYANGMVFADASDGIKNPDGLGFAANGDLMVANRSSGGDVLRIDPSGTTTLFDNIPGEDVLSLVIRDNGDIYVDCTSGNLYRYPGGVAASRVLFATFGGQNQGLRFSPDHGVLYHTNFGDGKVRTIDPDTASTVEVLDQGWGAIGIAVAGSQFAAGSFAPFGTGLAGAGGFVPALDGSGSPRLGQNVTLEIRDHVGGAMSYLMIGTSRFDQPLFGGTLYVDFATPYTIQGMVLPGPAGSPGAGDLDMPGVLSTDPALVSTSWYLQHFAVDVLAVGGISMTNGLLMIVGS